MIRKISFPKPDKAVFTSILTALVRSTAFFLLFYFACIQQAGAQNFCSCTDCPKPIIDYDTITSNLLVKGAMKNDLSTATQGVCRVCVKFKHDFVSDVRIQLISPSGQSITLVSPISQQGFTPFSQWDVCFVPCASLANPDPGFPAKWSNAGWGGFGRYKGSYYPYSGCLEDFNTGPVNGTWKLRVIDGDEIQAGTLLDWSIEFCEPFGLECLRCDAKPGSFSSYAPIESCRGDNKLNLKIPPVFTPANSAPSPVYYGYAYIISQNDTIKRIQPTADLRSLPSGNYSVCGFSYRLIDAANLPVPDGQLTLTKLKMQLATPSPTFCAGLSGTCVSVTIYPNPVTTISAKECRCYTLNAIKYCQSGIYQQQFKSRFGCDSLVNIIVNIVAPKIVNVNTTTCKGVPYILGKRSINSTGSYRDTLVSKQTGCDSIVNLNLLVRDPNKYNYTRTICEGDSVQQGAKFYKIQKVYTDTIKGITGCDSILVLDLKVNKGVVANIKRTICSSDSVVIGNRSFKKQGLYSVTLPLRSSNGCDSIVNLDLKVNPAYRDSMTLEICSGDTIRIGTSKYWQTGNYFDALTTKAGCDSLIWSFIQVKTTIKVVLKKDICERDVFAFDGKNLNTSGFYTSKNVSRNGCDSTTDLTLTVHKINFVKRNYILCNGDTLLIGPKKYASGGVFTDTLKTSFGCDSIHQSTITHFVKLESSRSQSICAPDSVRFGTKVYKTTGFYTETLQSYYGCDSVVRLDLKVFPRKDTLINLSYCFGKNPIQYPRSGDYVTKLKTQAGGCDSVITYRVVVYPEIKKKLNVQLCIGASITVANQKFDKTGSYIIQDTSIVSGCDSIIELSLTVTDRIIVNIDRVLCEGDTLYVGNNIYTENTKDTLFFQSTNGCDSIVYISLLVNSIDKILIQNTICEGSCIEIGGVNYCKVGVYNITSKNKRGCDSLTSITIRFKKRPVTDLTATICKGDFYQLGKKRVFSQGFHQDTLQALNGCDSILSLDLRWKFPKVDTVTQYICWESSLGSGYFTNKFIAANGCDSLHTIDRVRLEEKKSVVDAKVCRGQGITVGNTFYDKKGTYTKVINNVGPSRCDSIVTLNLDVVDSLVENKRVVLCNGETYTYNGTTYSRPSSIRATFVTAGQCDSIYYLDIDVYACIMRYDIYSKNVSCKFDTDGGISLQFQDSSYINYFYSWANLADGIFSPTYLIKGNGLAKIDQLGAGKYVFVVDNGNGLKRRDTITITKSQALKLTPTISAYQGFAVNCEGDSNGSIALAVSGGDPPYRYRWSDGDSTSTRANLPIGLYAVTITDKLNCVEVFDTLLASPKRLSAKVISKDPLCNDGAEGSIQVDSVQNGLFPLKYSLNDGALNTFSTFIKLKAGDYKIRVQDNRNCIFDTTATLKAAVPVVVNLGPDISIDFGETVLLKGAVSIPQSVIGTVLWNNVQDPQCPLCLEKKFTPIKSMQYLLSVFDKNNCKGEDLIYVNVKDLPVFIPNTFSPNDDGFNDFFTVFGDPTVFKVRRIHIFNRWGDLVFETTDILPSDETKGWDGKFKGLVQSDGMYVYNLEIELFDKSTRQLKGEVFLLK